MRLARGKDPTELEAALGGWTPRWGDLDWSEEEAFAAVVEGFRRDARSAQWMQAWCRYGVATRGHSLAPIVLEDPLAYHLLNMTWMHGQGWWLDDYDIARPAGAWDDHEVSRERFGRGDSSATARRPAPGVDPIWQHVVAGGAGAATRGDRGAGVGPRHGAGDLTAIGGQNPAWNPRAGDGAPCACDRGSLATASAAAVASSVGRWGSDPGLEPARLSLDRAALLHRCAVARAARAFGPGGRLDGRAGLVFVGSGRFVAARVGGWVAPRVVRAVPFARAVRITGGRLLEGVPICGLCGGAAAGAWDDWASDHLLTVPRSRRLCAPSERSERGGAGHGAT